MKKLVSTIAVVFLGTTAAFAQGTLIGSTVGAALAFPPPSSPLNYFDPANGYGLLPGYGGNPVSDTAVIGSPSPDSAAVFGFTDANNIDVANFTGNVLTVSNFVLAASGGSPSQPTAGIDVAWTMTFTDLSFQNATVTLLGSDGQLPFPGGLTETLSGTTLTLSWAGGSVADFVYGEYDAQYEFTIVPEPQGETTVALLGLAAVGWGRLKGRSKRQFLAL